MKRNFLPILLASLLLLLFHDSSYAKLLDDHKGIFINISEKGSDEFLNLDIEIKLSEKKILYEFSDSLYPMAYMGHLQIEVTSQIGENLIWELQYKVRPKFPYYRWYSVETDHFKYGKPLSLMLKNKNGDAFRDCGYITLTYDTTDKKYFKDKIFSRLKLISNRLHFCQK